MSEVFDVAVVGAGVFGAWTAYQLRRAGASVVLLDGYGPANSRASSGGESRMIRMGYGPDDFYTISSRRSLKLWRELFSKIDGRFERECSFGALFHRTGILWLGHDNDSYLEATRSTLERCKVRFEHLDHSLLLKRYPQFEWGPVVWGILEPGSGVLMARQAVQALVAESLRIGVVYLNEPALPPSGRKKPDSVITTTDRKVLAERFVFACGPWLPKMFPEVLGELIHVTRQEVFFLGAPAYDKKFAPPRLPAWIEFKSQVYGLPDVDGRGVKIAIDAHGPEFDPDNGERVITDEGVAAMRRFVSARMPELKDAPILEARVCQYENTSTGDFLIDLHPDFDNVWLVGGGSGHGFKHGPAVGEYVSERISGQIPIEPRFTLSTKTKLRQRKVF